MENSKKVQEELTDADIYGSPYDGTDDLHAEAMRDIEEEAIAEHDRLMRMSEDEMYREEIGYYPSDDDDDLPF